MIDEIKSSLSYEFEINPLSKLDIPSNIWIEQTRCRAVFRTSKGTGVVWTSDNCGSYDQDGVYHSTWFEIEWNSGASTMAATAISWEKAKEYVEKSLR